MALPGVAGVTGAGVTGGTAVKSAVAAMVSPRADTRSLPPVSVGEPGSARSATVTVNAPLPSVVVASDSVRCPSTTSAASASAPGACSVPGV